MLRPFLIALFMVGALLHAPPPAAAKKQSVLVIPGDTLGGLARKLGVRAKDLTRWNRALATGGLRVGKLIVVYSDLPVPRRSKQTYKVGKGDTLGAIAKRLKITVQHLRLVNRVDPRRLRPGMELQYYSESPGVDTQAIGHHNSGRLTDAVLLTNGFGYRVKDKNETWGTIETIEILKRCAAEHARMYPRAPPILIGDISLKRGGSFKPHKSHQTGLDVDIGYLQPSVPETTKRYNWASAKTLDIQKNWSLYRCLLRSEKVLMVFMDSRIQKLFKRALKKKQIKIVGYSTDRLFQSGSKTPHKAIFRHAKGHSDHIHVRFRCDEGDKRCQNTGEIYE